MRKYLISAFIIVSVIVYLFLRHEKEIKTDEYLQKTTHQISQNYDVVYNKYKKLSQVIFETQINTKNIKEIFKEAKDANVTQKALVREKLHKSLDETYKLLKKYNIKQLHFHLPDNESFLRFHKPQKFGDDLSAIRSTVKHVNETKKPIDGFEEGRIYNGYRFVFPLFENDQYLGSVEVSFSTLAMNIELIKNFDVIGKFLILKDIVDKKLFDSEKSNYKESMLNDFYYEKTIEDTLKKYNVDNIYLGISDETKEHIHKHAKDDVSFSLYDSKSNTIMTFLKVKNPVSNQVVGMFVFRSDPNFVITQKQNCIKLFFVSVFLLFLLILFIYRLLNDKNRLEGAIKRKTQSLIKSHNQMSKYVELIDENIISSSTDLKGIITNASKAFCNISGYSQDELIGKNHNIIRHPDMKKETFKNMWDELQSNNKWEGEVKNLKKDGNYYWVKAAITPNFDDNGKKIGYTAIRQDITDKKHIEEISITDALTNIFNRRHFNEIFPKVLNSSKRNNAIVCFMILDIDYFKQYNDTYGHQKGDDTLIEVAKCLKDTLKRSSDLCFRLGGEEFAIIYHVDKLEQSLQFAKTINKAIESLMIEHKTSEVCRYVTVSIGLVAKYAKDIKSTEQMYSEADKLLYKAKGNGRNKVISNV
jgi:diguanylate cyclase (GGDEF)-like protein/PAS domain S-box-containing protein